MNYIAEINAFEQWLETHHLPIPTQLLWYKLMSICNRAGWSEWVTVDNLRLMAAMQMSREATLIRARDELIKTGLIEYHRGKKGSPNRYHLISISGGNTFKSEVQSAVESEVQNEVYPEVKGVVQSADIYKQNINKTENIPPLSPVSRPDNFLSCYPGQSNRVQTAAAWADVLKMGISEEDLVTAASNYTETCRIQQTEARYIKRAENFLRDQTFDRYLPGKYVRPDPPEGSKTEQYNRFMKNSYDFETLEKQLLAGG